MRTVDPQKHAIQRQVIISAAKSCFARNGFHKTSTETICLEAHTSSGNLFHYFPNKKAIIHAVVEQQNQQTAAWIDALQEQPDFSEVLTDFLDGILHLAGDVAERRLILEIAAEGARDADVAVLNAQGDQLLTKGLTSLLTAAIANGQARPKIPDDHAVRFLMILVDGIFSRVAIDSTFDPKTERDALHVIVRTVMGIGMDRNHA
jgi:TetR/AcrR family transcriptional regulator, repressor for uid operon